MSQSPYHLQYRASRSQAWISTNVSAKRPAAIRRNLRDYETHFCEEYHLNPACIELRIITNGGREIHRLDRDGDHFSPYRKAA